MVKVAYDDKFKKLIQQLNHGQLKHRVKKQILKVLQNPLVGKPMRFARKGTRELYIGSYRLVYYHDMHKDVISFLDIYHKDKQ